MLYLISLILYVIAVTRYIIKSSPRKLVNPNTWIVIIYSFLLIVHFTFDVKFNAGNKYSALPYFSVCLFALIWGVSNGYKKTTKNKSYRSYAIFNIRRVAYLSFFASLVLIVDIIRNNNILLIGARIEDFEISLIGVLANFFAGLGLIPWLAQLYLFLLKNKSLPLFSFLSLFAFVAYDIVTGGRQTLFAAIISTIVMVAWCIKVRKQSICVQKIKIPKGIYVAAILFSSYFLVVSSIRTIVQDTDERISSLEYVFSATIGDETKDLIPKLGPLSSIYTEFGMYYSHELNRLDILLDYYNEPVYFIPFEMSFITRRIPFLSEIGNKQWKKQEQIFGSRVDFFSHTWSTFLGNFYVDYGFFGSIFMCFISGLLMGRFRRRFENTNEAILLVRLCVLMGGIFISIEFSPLSQLPWVVCMFFSSFFNLKDEQGCIL